jgi:hypothetical protein
MDTLFVVVDDNHISHDCTLHELNFTDSIVDGITASGEDLVASGYSCQVE